MTISLPQIVSKSPLSVEVEKGKKYFWCACGLSKKAPFCDGSHKEHKGGDGLPLIKSVVFEADENKVVRFCNCKHSKKGVLCDGSHNSL